MASAYALGPCCCAFFLALLACGFFAAGMAVLANLDAKYYRETTCSVVSSQLVKHPRLAKTYHCDLSVTIPETLQRKWEVEATAANTTHCTEFGDNCNYNVPNDCSGVCYLVVEDGEYKEVDVENSRLASTFVGIFITSCGAMSLCSCIACCFCTPLVSAYFSPKKAVVSDEKDTIGKSYDPASLQRPLGRLLSCLKYVVGLFGILGIFTGVYIGGILSYLSSRELKIGDTNLPQSASWVGYGMALLAAAVTVLLWFTLALVHQRVNQVLNDFALKGCTQEQVQQQCAQLVLAQLNSRKGEGCKNKMLDAGISEAMIERIMTSPPDKMCDVLLEVCGASVQASLMCMFLEEIFISAGEQLKQQFVLCFLGMPSLMTMMVFLLAMYCARFEQQVLASTIPGILCVAALLFLLLGWLPLYSITMVVGLAGMLMTTVIVWIADGSSAPSILVWLFGCCCYVCFLPCCAVWHWCLSPVCNAFLAYFMETVRVHIFQSFGLDRGQVELDKRKGELEHSMGFAGFILKRLAGLSGT